MKMTPVTKFAVLVAAVTLTLSLLVGCDGGGGGESASAPATPVTPAPIPPTECPDGSAIPATGTKDCPVVGPVSPITETVVTPRAFQGFTISFSGDINPNSVTSTNVVLWKGTVGTGTKVAGIASPTSNQRELRYVATQILASGSSYVLDINATDSLGRPVHLTIPFTTTAMVCADNAIWSNPANYSTVYHDCVADVGVQTLVNKSWNTLQDETCVVTTGVPLTPECKAYMANGTMILSKTSIVANGHSTMWMAYIGKKGKSSIVLLDTNDPNGSAIPLGTIVLTSDLVWITGNPTGTAIAITTSTNGVTKNEQVTWNASSSTLVETCVKNC